ncbi:MAG: hypothetical protein DRI23_12755, partial [Candidatus Cloacimonadota bacterium]
LCTGDTGGTYSQSTSSLSYGNLDIGNSSTLQFQISNAHGSEYLMGDITTITGYTVSVAVKGDVKEVKNVLSYSVAPNSSKIFDLKFEPGAGGDFNGNITITSSDTNHSNETIAVTGTCLVPDIDVPASLAASAAPETSTIRNFDIDNTDAGELTYNIAINYTSGKDIKASGGPDTYGYKWVDSDEAELTYNWTDISGTGTEATTWSQTGTYDGKDEGYSGPYDLGFSFNYYGVAYTQVYVESNGFLMFTAPTADAYTNATIPTAGHPDGILAAFWDDLDGSSQGTVHYKQVGSDFIVQYTNWPDYGSSNGNTFQIVLSSSGSVLFQYNSMTGDMSSCTVGIESPDGSDGSLATYNAAYLKDSFAVKFSATPEWLSLDKTSGTVSGFGSDTIASTCDATGLELGVYTADMVVTSNDPDESSVTIPVTFTVTNVVAPDVPANIVTSIVGSNLVVDWDVSSGATSYDVYSSDDPYGTFTFVTNVGTNQYTVAANQAKLFYYIVAKN